MVARVLVDWRWILVMVRTDGLLLIPVMIWGDELVRLVMLTPLVALFWTLTLAVVALPAGIKLKEATFFLSVSAVMVLLTKADRLTTLNELKLRLLAVMAVLVVLNGVADRVLPFTQFGKAPPVVQV